MHNYNNNDSKRGYLGIKQMIDKHYDAKLYVE